MPASKNPKLIIVTGLPATGKTWLATELSQAFHIPLIAKDPLKISILEFLGTADRAWDRKIGIAAIHQQILFARELLSKNIPVILESNFKQEFDASLLMFLVNELKVDCLQIVCGAQGEVLVQRFSERMKMDASRKALGEKEFNNTEEWTPMLLKGFDDPLNIPGKVLTVDTTDFSKVNLNEIKRNMETFLFQ